MSTALLLSKNYRNLGRIKMTRWEYRVDYFADTETRESLDGNGMDTHLNWLTKELSKYGSKGWELLNVNFDTQMIDGFWVFRREIHSDE